MKKIFILLVISTSVFVLSSCSMMVFKIMGINPKPETPESVLAFCKENNVYYDYLFMPENDSLYIDIFARGITLGEFSPFDKDKRHLTLLNSEGRENQCPKILKYRYQDLEEEKVIISDSDSLFWTLLKDNILIDKKEGLADIRDTHYDFYLIGGWGKMRSAKQNLIQFRSMKTAAQVDKDKDVCIILINYDTRNGNSTFKKAVNNAKKLHKKQSKKR